MNETNANNPSVGTDTGQSKKAGDTVTVTCDDLIEFEEGASQPASAWPWPEPAFVPESKPAKAKD